MGPRSTLIGMCKKDLIKVGFLVSSFYGWTGGMNYLRNLLIAINSIPSKSIVPFLFIDKEIDDDFLESIKSYASLVEFGHLYHKGFCFIQHNKLHRWYKTLRLHKHINKLNIEVMSHSSLYGAKYSFLTVNWIPDFQHLHLPEMFSEKECSSRTREFRNIIGDSDAVVLSSSDSIKDANNFFPGHGEKLHRLAFVSITEENMQDRVICVDNLERKYDFSGKYFYLPNQFWKHKNHLVVFDAVLRLKNEGINILVICTGDLTDYRNEDHVNELKNFVTENDLSGNISLLGKIPYTDVLSLFRFALAVLNPSLFEGWSSTVEEAKTIGKKVILSNIAVHKEQAASCAEYFDPKDPEELAGILSTNWNNPQQEDLNSDEIKTKHLQERVVAYGSTYQNIILEVTRKI